MIDIIKVREDLKFLVENYFSSYSIVESNPDNNVLSLVPFFEKISPMLIDLNKHLKVEDDLEDILDEVSYIKSNSQKSFKELGDNVFFNWNEYLLHRKELLPFLDTPKRFYLYSSRGDDYENSLKNKRFIPRRKQDGIYFTLTPEKDTLETNVIATVECWAILDLTKTNYMKPFDELRNIGVQMVVQKTNSALIKSDIEVILLNQNCILDVKKYD